MSQSVLILFAIFVPIIWGVCILAKKEFKRSILDKIKNLYFGSTSKTPFNEFALDNIRNDLK